MGVCPCLPLVLAVRWEGRRGLRSPAVKSELALLHGTYSKLPLSTLPLVISPGSVFCCPKILHAY